MKLTFIQVLVVSGGNVLVQPQSEELAVMCAGIAAECAALAKEIGLPVVLMDREGYRYEFTEVQS